MSRLVFDTIAGTRSREPSVTPDRRRSARATPMIRPAKLIIDKHETLCVVLNLSEGGARLRLFHSLPQHDYLAIELENGERHAVQLVWEKGEQIGCSFVVPVDLSELLSKTGEHHPAREPRVVIELVGVLYADSIKTQVLLRDISQRGAAIDCPGWLMIDEAVRIECRELPTIHGKVRWRRPPHYGLVLEKIFSLADLALVCARLNRGPDRVNHRA